MTSVPPARPVRTYRYEAELLTPLITAGENQRPSQAALRDEGLRVPLLRHALRYWYRALVAGAHSSLFGTDEIGEMVFSMESALFGKGSAASPVRLRSHGVDVSMQDRVSLSSKARATGFKTGSTFSVTAELDSRRWVTRPEELHRHFTAAMWLAVHLGGFGRRSRRGFGSFAASSPRNASSLGFPFTLSTETTDIVEVSDLYECALASAHALVAPVSASPSSIASPGIPALCRTGVRIWLVSPTRESWVNGDIARDALIKQVYNQFKTGFSYTCPTGRSRNFVGRSTPGAFRIGCGYAPGGGKAVPSPLLLSVNRAEAADGNHYYFGVVVAWHDAVHANLPRPYFADYSGNRPKVSPWAQLDRFMLTLSRRLDPALNVQPVHLP